jgi:two-component system, NarL family, invasion response regulator UvrY
MTINCLKDGTRLDIRQRTNPIPMKILIADDHAAMKLLIKRTLTTEYPSGLIEEVKDGQELVTRALSDQWDLVISDISMPVMTGLEALEEIRKHSPNLPVIILSSHSEEVYIQHALRAGAAAYVQKYRIHEDLSKTIRRVMGSGTNPTSPSSSSSDSPATR